MPQFHDMGLIGGFMTTIYARTHAIVCSPLDFIQRPLVWHEMITKYKATYTCAPNFAFGLVLRHLAQQGLHASADWSCLHCVVLGGEPTEASIVERLCDELHVHPDAVYNMFGMAECGLRVTAGSALIYDGAVSCGDACDGLVTTRIVETENGVLRVLPDGTVGNIWVRTSLAASGYWGQTESSKATFANTLPGEDGVWLDTGDLGKIVDDMLFVTGRLKDVIIIFGKNYFATDIERSLEDNFASQLRPGSTAAFQHGSAGVGIAAEMRKGKADFPDLARIKTVVQQTTGVELCYLLICRAGTLPKTQSGKLKRSVIRQQSARDEWAESAVFLNWEKKVALSGAVGVSEVAPVPLASRGELHPRQIPVQATGKQAQAQPQVKRCSTADVDVAVVGGGASGLTCALKLAQAGLRVAVIEREPRLGGHASHVEVFGGHQRNPAFGAFQQDQWPNAWRLFDELGVERVQVCEAGRDFAQRYACDGHSTALPDESERLRFLDEMSATLHSKSNSHIESVTIGEYFEEHGYGADFVYGFFLGTVVHYFAGQSTQTYLEYPLRLVAWMFVGAFLHGGNKPVYRLRNKEYMDKFRTALEALGVVVYTDTHVAVSSRSDTQVELTLLRGDTRITTDHLVLAIPPDAALQVSLLTATEPPRDDWVSTIDSAVQNDSSIMRLN